MSDYNQYDNNAYIQRTAGYAINPGARNIAAKAVNDKNNNIALVAGTTVAGSAACWGLSKGVDVFSKTSDLDSKTAVGEYTNTRLYKLIDKIDEWSKGWSKKNADNPTFKWINERLAGIKASTKTNIIDPIATSDIYGHAMDSMRKSTGKETFMVDTLSTKQQLMGELAGEFEKLPEDKRVSLGNIIEELKKGTADHTKISEALNKDIEILGRETYAAQGLFKGIQQKATSGRFDASKVELLMNKIGLLQHAEGKGLLVKMFGKGLIGTSHFLGGGPIGIIMNGFFIGQTIKSTVDAPKGEKLKTFMEDLLGNWIGGWVMLAPIGKLVNKMANLKFIKTEGKGIGHKILKGIGNVVGLGVKDKPRTDEINEVKEVFAKGGKAAVEALEGAKGKKLAETFLEKVAGHAGSAGRFALVMMVITPLFTNLFTKISHSIFGTPTKSKKDKNKKEIAQPQVQTPNIQSTPQTNPVQPQFNGGFIPSSTPSPNLALDPQGDKINKAMQVSDMAIQNAQNVLQNINSM